MVRARWGASRLGCLVTVAVLVAAVYFGFRIGRVYWDYYQYEYAMKQHVRFAETMTDRQLNDRVVAKADSLGLPDEAKDVTVERVGRHIAISADYTVQVALPLHTRAFHFTPRAEHDF